MNSFAVSNSWVLGPLFCFGVALLWKFVLSLRFKSALRRHGCSPITRYPHKDPIFGLDLYRIIAKSKQQNDATSTMQRLIESHGNGKTFQALTLGIPTVYTADPRIIRAILAKDAHHFGVEPIRKNFHDPWITKGLLVTDGQQWKSSRTMLMPLFQKSQYANLPTLQLHVGRVLDLIPRDGRTLDLQPLLCDLVC